MLKINYTHYREIKNNIDEILGIFHKTFALISGIFAKFCFYDGGFFPFIAFFMFYIVLTILRKIPDETKLKNSFSTGFWFGIGYFGSTLYWVIQSFKCVGMGNYGYIAVIVLVLYLSLYSALACLLTRLLQTNRINQILFFCIFWVAGEYLRGIAFTGFPWNLIGYATLEIPYFCQAADIFGIYGISFIFLLAVTTLSYKKTFLYGIALSLITLSYGYYKVEIFSDYKQLEHKNNITAVQASIQQEDKLNPNKFRDNLEKHIALSNFSGVSDGKRLVIWPEAAINTTINSNNGVLEYISSHISHPDTFIFTGADRRDANNTIYNSSCIIGTNAKILQTYDKRHLLPFGEFIPEFLLDLGLRKVTQGALNFSRGNASRSIKINNFDQFDVLICYEIVFPGEILDNKDTKWILNITNDAWFKVTDGPMQHLKTVCLRAIEEGRPIVRCANNGISCIIDCKGKIISKLNTNQIGAINSSVPSQYIETIYSRYKNMPIFFIMIILFLATYIFRRKSKNIIDEQGKLM